MGDTESEFDSRFQQEFGEQYDSIRDATTGSLHITVVGKVSTGKSSLINALLQRTKENKVAEVGVESGKTTMVKGYRMGPVLIYDTPGLGDIQKQNTREAQDFLRQIDVGIFVVTDSADKDQYDNFVALKERSAKVFFVLNQVDRWDGMAPTALEKVISQWSTALDLDKIYPTIASGYDDDDLKPLRIEGVDELRRDLIAFLRTRHQDLLLARILKDKTPVVAEIILGALVAVGAEAFIPGSEIYITATQIASIASLYYVYKGKMIDKREAIAVVPAVAARTVGKTLFLWAASFVPPTGVINAVAAAIAVSITAALLLAVAWSLQNDIPLSDKQAVSRKYGELFPIVKNALKNSTKGNLSNRSFYEKLISDILGPSGADSDETPTE